MDPRQILLCAMDGAFDRRGWQGPNLVGTLRRVSPTDAVRTVAGRKSIWEQLLHAAYWKYRVLRTFTHNARLKFPRRGSDWPPLPSPADETAWLADLAMLRDLHAQLRRAVETAPMSAFTAKAVWLLQGSAAHDAYHAGQARLLIRLLQQQPRAPSRRTRRSGVRPVPAKSFE